MASACDKSVPAIKARNLAKNLAEKADSLAAALPALQKTGKAQDKNRQYKSENAGHDRKNNLGAGALSATTWWDRVARLREDDKAAKSETAYYLLANGRGVSLDRTSPLFGKLWFVCVEFSGRAANARIKAVAELEEPWLRQYLADKITEETYMIFDAENRALRAFRQRKLGAILLENVPMPKPAGEEADYGWLQAVRDCSLGILPWDKVAEALRAACLFASASGCSLAGCQ